MRPISTSSLQSWSRHVVLLKYARHASSTAAAASAIPAVVGSAPTLQRHLILHTGHGTSEWPSHFESVSEVYKALGELAKEKKLDGLGFNFSDAAVGMKESSTMWDSKRIRFEDPPKGQEEEYDAMLYPDFIRIPSLSLRSLDDFAAMYAALPPPRVSPPLAIAQQTTTAPSEPSADRTDVTPGSPSAARVDIYVCCHGSRDCRCSDLGEPLYQALVHEARRRRIDGTKQDEGQVRIARIGHVGGHKWAGNALVYRAQDGEDAPRADWYGLLREEDARKLLDVALQPESDVWWNRWRGRVGMTPEQVKDAYLEGTSGEPAAAKKRKEKVRSELGDPIELLFRSWDGRDEYRVKGYEGESVMETARRHDLPSILATCGGHLECATCHVHVSEEPTPPVPDLTDEEEEQLDFAMGRKDDSRLACQVPVTKALGEWVKSGGVIGLPRY